jgi:dihydrofolate reductase
MRKVVAGTFMSIDGVMQAPGGPEEDPTGGFAYGGWSVNYWDDAMMAEIGKSMADPFDLLLGRKTYEIFAAHWPYAGDDNPVASKFNTITKYVATSSTAPLSWKNSVAIRGNVAAEIAGLKQTDGANLLIQGSSQLIQTLLANDLIDEFNLRIFPLVLGSGKRLFGAGAMPAALKLVDSRTSATGVTANSYRRAGEIKAGTFELVGTTQAELDRRERMKREG